jgi:hypothetical protein
MSDHDYKLDVRAPLTDAEMTELESFALQPYRQVTMPTMRLRRILNELHSHRAAALSPEDVDALKWLRVQARAIQYDRVKAGSDGFPNPTRALALIDRLLAAGSGK